MTADNSSKRHLPPDDDSSDDGLEYDAADDSDEDSDIDLMPRGGKSKLSSTGTGGATSSTDENRLEPSSENDAESYGLSNKPEGGSDSDDDVPGWQQVRKVDAARPELSAESPKKKRRKSHDLTVLIGCNAVVFLASICVMVLELTASRLIAKHVGSSLYTWTSVIGVVLAGITVGNFLGGWLADRFKPEKLVSRLFIIASVSCLSVLWLDQLVGTSDRPAGVDWSTWVFLTVAQMFFLPAMALGTISPVVASIALSHTKRTGITVGNVYAWGAMGSIIGTFLTGFYLIDTFGTRAIIGGTAGALALLGVFAASGQLVMRVWILFGWMQFLTGVTLAASVTAESVGGASEAVADVFVSRNATLIAVRDWYRGNERVLAENLREELADMSQAGRLEGMNEQERRQLESWAKTGRRDRMEERIETLLRRSFVDLGVADEKVERWRDRGELLGKKLHELGILLYLRGDTIGEYHDESNYSYVNVSDDVDEASGDDVKQLRLDKLAHSYINLAEPSKLYYEYELIYAEVTHHVAESWQTKATARVTPFSGLNEIVNNLPAWASYDAENDVLSVTGTLTADRRELLLKISKHGEYWLALDDLAKATREEFWGGFSSVSLKSIPAGADGSKLLKEKMSYEPNFGVLNAFQELSNEDVERLAAIGDAAPSAVWRTAVNSLFQESRSVSTFFIGGGGFVFPRWIEHHYPKQSRIDVAELDPAVKLAVQKEMGLADDEDTLVNTLIGDARNVVDDVLLANRRRKPGEPAVKYDFIYGDAFNDLSVPWHLTTHEFNQKVKALLDERHGVYLMNIIDIWPRAEYPDSSESEDSPAGEGLVEEDGYYYIIAFEGEVPDDWKVEYDVLEDWQPLRDPAFSGAESMARDDGKFRLGFRGLMTNEMRDRLIALQPKDADYVKAIDTLFNKSQSAKTPGRFISACLKTLAEDFPNMYVFSTQHGPPSEFRDTYVIAASLAPLDFSMIELDGKYWDTAPFATYEKTDKAITKTGQMDALLNTARGLVLTDDFAPVDRLLRPVFVDQD